MSGFIGAAMPVSMIAVKDERLSPQSRRRLATIRPAELTAVGIAPAKYASAYWPGNRGFIGNQSADVGMLDCSWRVPMERIALGMASRVGFPGTTRDQYGAPLASATVILHRTSTREFVNETVSDANGLFLAQSVYAGEAHYLVFHKSGAGNVFGATDNNLIGA